MKDSLLLMDIYKRYLNVTHDLISILERNCKKEQENGELEELKNKYKEFRKHAHGLIESLNIDLHCLIKIDYELKELEEIEEKNV